MNRYVYVGDKTDKETGGRNLGRFGMVRIGEVLILTPKEEVCIIGDPRFERFDETKHDKNPEATAATETAAELEAIRQMSPDAIREKAKELGIKVPRGTPTAKVLALVLAHYSNPNTPQPEEE